MSTGLLKWNGKFQSDRSDGSKGAPVGRNRYGPFHVTSDRNFPNLWHNGKHDRDTFQLPG